MSSEIFFDPAIFTKSYEEALKANKRTLSRIRSFKKELEDVKINLELNQNYLFQNIMVPIGSKAFMKGKLVHTNEVTINVGDRWFIKKSAAGAIQTCNRMIQRCDENLAEYEKEMHLLCSNLEMPNDYEIFASGDVQEIVEPYDEEEEKQWREKHRRNVRAYKQQLAATRQSEEDLFQKLDKLEKQEDQDPDEDDEDSDDDDEDIDEEEFNELIEESIQMNKEIAKTTATNLFDCTETSDLPKKPRKRVSFSDSLETTQEFTTSSLNDEIDIIYFKHTQRKNSPIAPHDDAINSPSDIYRRFLFEMENISRKSILKKTHSTEKWESPENTIIDQVPTEVDDSVFTNENNSYEGNRMETVQRSIIKIKRNFDDANTSISLDEISPDEVFGDIVEKTPEVLPKIENSTRPVSKFKKSRAARTPNT